MASSNSQITDHLGFVPRVKTANRLSTGGCEGDLQFLLTRCLNMNSTDHQKMQIEKIKN